MTFNKFQEYSGHSLPKPLTILCHFYAIFPFNLRCFLLPFDFIIYYGDMDAYSTGGILKNSSRQMTTTTRKMTAQYAITSDHSLAHVHCKNSRETKCEIWKWILAKCLPSMKQKEHNSWSCLHIEWEINW